MINLPVSHSAADALARQEIEETIRYERYCRDNGQWQEMRRMFAKDATINISWYHGTASGFIDASAQGAVQGAHVIEGVLTWLNGDRAMSVVSATIRMRRSVDDQEYEVMSHVRLVYQLVRHTSGWAIDYMTCIYGNDSVAATAPQTLPAQHEHVRCIFTNADKVGLYNETINNELPGIDRPASVDKVLQASQSWLRQD